MTWKAGNFAQLEPHWGLTARPWKTMVGRRSFPFESRPIAWSYVKLPGKLSGSCWPSKTNFSTHTVYSNIQKKTGYHTKFCKSPKKQQSWSFVEIFGSKLVLTPIMNGKTSSKSVVESENRQKNQTSSRLDKSALSFLAGSSYGTNFEGVKDEDEMKGRRFEL